MKRFLSIFPIFYAVMFFLSPVKAASDPKPSSQIDWSHGVKKITDHLYVGKAQVKRKDGSTDHVWIGMERIDTGGDHHYEPHSDFYRKDEQVLHYNDQNTQRRYEFWENFVTENVGYVDQSGQLTDSSREKANKYKEKLKRYYWENWPDGKWKETYGDKEKDETNVTNEVLSHELAKQNKIVRKDKMPVELPEGVIHMSFDRARPNSLSTGFTSFKMMLKYNKYNELWVAFVSTKPIEKVEDINYDTIEMAVTVTTSPDAPMTHHMGINRSILHMTRILDGEATGHGNLAIPLHAFAARVMKMRYPDKVYMITSPVDAMYHVLTTQAPHIIKWDARKKPTDPIYNRDQYSLAKTEPDHPKVKERDQTKCKLKTVTFRKTHLETVREELWPWSKRNVLGENRYIERTTTELGKIKGEIWATTDEEEQLKTELRRINHAVEKCVTYVIKSPDGTKDIFTYNSVEPVVQIGEKRFTGDQLKQFYFFDNIHNTLSNHGVALDLGELAKAVDLVD